MAYLGTLVEWNDQRGFGFIQTDDGGDPVFVHISAFSPRPSVQARPHVGMRLKFVIGSDHGRKRAQQVLWRNVDRKTMHVPAQVQNYKSASKQAGGAAYLAILAFAVFLLVVAWVWQIPRWVLSMYVVFSLMAFFAYWKDKKAAQAGRWRTPESTLHALAVSGGWPGALLAQRWLGHKNSKRSFLRVFYGTVFINVLMLAVLSSPWCRRWLASLQWMHAG